jgi:hypothetical protein
MVTLDDRLLGEKLQNYCSSSEDEDDRGNLFDDNFIYSSFKMMIRVTINEENQQQSLFRNPN